MTIDCSHLVLREAHPNCLKSARSSIKLMCQTRPTLQTRSKGWTWTGSCSWGSERTSFTLRRHWTQANLTCLETVRWATVFSSYLRRVSVQLGKSTTFSTSIKTTSSTATSSGKTSLSNLSWRWQRWSKYRGAAPLDRRPHIKVWRRNTIKTCTKSGLWRA